MKKRRQLRKLANLEQEAQKIRALPLLLPEATEKHDREIPIPIVQVIQICFAPAVW